MSETLRYDGQVVVVTGAGGGLGKAYALYYGYRGASVVVNDLGGSGNGQGSSSKAADIVVDEIKTAGGKAVANYDSVEFGNRIIDTAISSFGRVDILINNAGILRDISFKNITDQDWDLITKVHIFGAYKCTSAAWPYFLKQGYGRVINTASAAGLYGNFGQTNYSAAKLALVGYTKTLAREGAPHNILCNVIAPIAASRLTATVMPPDLLKALKPEFVVPLVGVLTHKSSSENGSIFEVGGGFAAKLRWQRSQGLLLKTDESFTPSAILSQWDQLVDFDKNPQYPEGPANFPLLLRQSGRLNSAKQGDKIDFSGKVVLVTAGGTTVGRAYSLAFAAAGASVVVQDAIDPNKTVAEIKNRKGKAIGIKTSTANGDELIQEVIKAFGRIDILINSPNVYEEGKDQDSRWISTLDNQLRNTYKLTKAAWPHFLKQKYGRVINTTSTSAMYGKEGQDAFATAKLGVLGFSRALALEGAKYNIHVNAIAPSLSTTANGADTGPGLSPNYISPLVLALCSDDCPDPTGGLYEVGAGWCAKLRWQQAGGVCFPVNLELTPETVLKHWSDIASFNSGREEYPERSSDSTGKIMANLENTAEEPATESNEYLDAIKEALGKQGPPVEFNYEERDTMLYNIGIGSKSAELKYVFEGDEDFQVIPTFGVLPGYTADMPFGFGSVIPNFNPMMLLHGEQYLEIRKYPIPTSAHLLSKSSLIEVVDKGNAAVVKTGLTVTHAETGEDIFYNEMTAFVRGSGGFNGTRKPADRGAATAVNKPPARAPDVVVESATHIDQASIFRLSGDYNPLHIDPSFAKMGGFKKPILHGLCTFGIAGKAIYDKFGAFKNIKVRFAGTVDPGQTIVTEMWREDNRIIFQCKVKETGKMVIGGAAAELVDNKAASKI